MVDPNFVYLAGAITFIGIALYAIDTIKGKTKPNRVTWILWTIVPLITFFAQLGKDVGISSIFTLSYALGPLLVVIASFSNKNAYWKLDYFDYLCGSIAILAIALWLITGNGILAIVFSVAADFTAGLPTLRKAFIEPTSESFIAYLLGVLSAIITLLTVQAWNTETVLFPVYILLNSALICLTIKVFYKFSRTNQNRG